MSFGQSLTLESGVFELLDLGRYIRADSTTDEPQYLSIDNTINPDGASSFVIKRQHYRNNPTVGLPDVFAQAHVVLRTSRSFTRTEIDMLFSDLVNFSTSERLTKLYRGER